MRYLVWTAAVAFALLAVGQAAEAGDRVTVAQVTASTAWDFQVVDFGIRKGFFEKAGIDVQVATTDNIAASLQAVIAGSADIANVSVTAFMGAAIKGAPVKMISSEFRGTSDLLWYVRAGSPIRSFKDLTEKNSIGVISFGTSQYVVTMALLAQSGVKANVVAVGTVTAGMVAVMTGQVDVGIDGNGLLGVPEYARGEVRAVAFGRELEATRGVSVRGFVVRNDMLHDRRDVIVRFLKAYQATVDWMYRDPEAIAWLADKANGSVDEARRVRTDLYPEGAMDVGVVTGVDTTVAQGLAFKRIERAPTADELAGMFELVWVPGK